MTLTESPLDVTLTVSCIDAGQGATSRLTSMGILPGEDLKLLSRGQHGPLVVEVKGTRVAIGRGLAVKVRVTKNSEKK